jgi:hypothetical protein
MKIGIFIHPFKKSVLVAMDYGNWTERITEAGFPRKPALVRNATTPEVVAFEERENTFPAWEYCDFNELLDDEEHSGADRKHLESLLRLVVQIADYSQQPQKAMIQ